MKSPKNNGRSGPARVFPGSGRLVVDPLRKCELEAGLVRVARRFSGLSLEDLARALPDSKGQGPILEMLEAARALAQIIENTEMDLSEQLLKISKRGTLSALTFEALPAVGDVQITREALQRRFLENPGARAQVEADPLLKQFLAGRDFPLDPPAGGRNQDGDS